MMFCTFQVGFFPSEYVEVIGDRIPPAMASQIPETPPKPGESSTLSCEYPRHQKDLKVSRI